MAATSRTNISLLRSLRLKHASELYTFGSSGAKKHHR
jgi:hypothetical protein